MAILKDLFNSGKSYNVILTDPAWKQTKGGLRKARPNQGKELDYNTITLEEIKEYQRQAMNLAAQDHSVFMWTIDKYLHEAEAMMVELGYKLHARIIWDKTNGIAPAFTVRYSHEYLLWFYKDKLPPIAKGQRGKFTTVMREASTVHSRKPAASFSFIEALYPNTEKLEMYARQTRAGWDCWGNELEGESDANNG